MTDNHKTDRVSSSSENHFSGFKTTTTKKTKIKSHALNDDAILNEYSPVKNYSHKASSSSSSSLASSEFYHSSLQPTIVGNTDHFQFLPYKKRKFDTLDELSSSSSSTLSSRSHYNADKFLFDNKTPPEYERIKKSNFNLFSKIKIILKFSIISRDLSSLRYLPNILNLRQGIISFYKF